MRKILIAAVSLILLSACGGGSEEGSADPAPTATATVTATVEVTASTAAVEGAYPKGFPKKVAVSGLPDQMQYTFEGKEFVVAIAPGVWTELAPGTTVEESAAYGTYEGYCASIKAYEAKYSPEPRGSSCY